MPSRLEAEYRATAELQGDNPVISAQVAPKGTSAAYGRKLQKLFRAGRADAKAVFREHVSDDVADDVAHTAGTAHYDPAAKRVHMSFARGENDLRGPGCTFFHEAGHYINDISAPARLSGALTPSLQKGYNDLMMRLIAAQTFRAVRTARGGDRIQSGV